MEIAMTLAYWCVFIAALLPYGFTVLAKTGPGFNNHTPREYLERTQGWRKRAHWAQLNGFEAFPAFAAAVIIAHLQTVPQFTLNALAITFITTRLLHGIFYLANLATLRSLFWGLGFVCVVALFILSAFPRATTFFS